MRASKIDLKSTRETGWSDIIVKPVLRLNKLNGDQIAVRCESWENETRGADCLRENSTLTCVDVRKSDFTKFVSVRWFCF